MTDEKPIKIIVGTLTGDQFIETLKTGNPNSIWTYHSTRGVIISFIISILAFLLVWIFAFYNPKSAWYLGLVTIICFYFTFKLFYEVVWKKEYRMQTLNYVKFLGLGKTLEISIFQNHLLVNFDEKVQTLKWENLELKESSETVMLLYMHDDEFIFLMQPSFSTEDFEYLRKFFQEKLG
jgi:uncharacterized membrane protein